MPNPLPLPLGLPGVVVCIVGARAMVRLPGTRVGTIIHPCAAHATTTAGTRRSPGRKGMIVTRGLTKRFGAKLAVDGVDLDVGASEVFGFLGPNGAGKTTTVRMLSCLIA